MSNSRRHAENCALEQFTGQRVFVLVGSAGTFSVLAGALRSCTDGWLQLEDTNLIGADGAAASVQVSHVIAIWGQGR